MSGKKIVVKRKPNIRAFAASQLQGLAIYLPALFSFLQVKPEWQLAFAGAASLYAVYMAYNQDDINHVIQFIDEHPEELSRELVQTTEFQKAFIIFLEQYLKERIKIKKEILKQVFLGYASSADKGQFELERLDDCVSRISISTLEFLSFFQKEIMPQISEQVAKELSNLDKGDKSKGWWTEQTIKRQAIWGGFIDKWVTARYGTNVDRVREEHKLSKDANVDSDLMYRSETRERTIRSEFHEALSELVTLGIIDIRVTDGGIGSSAGKDYNLTSFGLNFLQYAQR